MGRIYTINMAASTLTSGTGTILFLNPPASRSLRLMRVVMGQVGTETADALVAQLFRQVTSFPTLVTTNAQLAKRDPNDSNSALTLTTTGAAGTAGVNASAEGAGAKTPVLDLPGFLNTAGLDFWFPPESRIVLPAGDTSGLGLRFPTAPASLTGWSASFTWEES